MTKSCAAAKSQGAAACDTCMQSDWSKGLQQAGCAPADAEGYCSVRSQTPRLSSGPHVLES